jgi:hypothetical protein
MRGGMQAVGVVFCFVASLMMAWTHNALGFVVCLAAAVTLNRAFIKLNPPPKTQMGIALIASLLALAMVFVSAWMQSAVGIVAYAVVNVVLLKKSQT